MDGYIPDLDYSGFDGQDGIEDGLLQMDDGNPGDIAIDPGSLGLDPGQDIQTKVDLLPSQSDESQTEDVEQDLIELLENGGQADIVVLAGEKPNVRASVSTAAMSRFSHSYARAARVNPALRWYAKFAALLPPEKFGVRQGALRISMSPKMYAKVVHPFLGDFHAKFARTSPIVAAVHALAASVRNADLAAKRARVQSDQRRASHAHDPSDFDPGEADFGAEQLSDQAGRLADLGEGDDGLGQDGIVENPDVTTAAPRSSLSLTDLSHKAIADHLASEGGDDNTIMDRMMGEGFTRSRANEILSMVRYKKLLASRRAGRYAPEGNTGTGFAEFEAR